MFTSVRRQSSAPAGEGCSILGSVPPSVCRGLSPLSPDEPASMAPMPSSISKESSTLEKLENMP